MNNDIAESLRAALRVLNDSGLEACRNVLVSILYDIQKLEDVYGLPEMSLPSRGDRISTKDTLAKT